MSLGAGTLPASGSAHSGRSWMTTLPSLFSGCEAFHPLSSQEHGRGRWTDFCWAQFLGLGVGSRLPGLEPRECGGAGGGLKSQQV